MIKSETFRFDILLSVIVLCLWVKLVIIIKISKTLGPLYKIFQEMTQELMKFLGLWMMVLTIFTCFSVLAFSQLEFFHDIVNVFVYFFEASCGNFNMDLIVYVETVNVTDADGNTSEVEVEIENMQGMRLGGEVF